MIYKGYAEKIEFDDEAMAFHGEVIGIRDVVTFQGTSVEELRQAFEDSVDDYLDLCSTRGEEPNKPFSGRFVARISPEAHRKIFLAAKKEGLSVKAWISQRLQSLVG